MIRMLPSFPIGIHEWWGGLTNIFVSIFIYRIHLNSRDRRKGIWTLARHISSGWDSEYISISTETLRTTTKKNADSWALTPLYISNCIHNNVFNSVADNSIQNIIFPWHPFLHRCMAEALKAMNKFLKDSYFPLPWTHWHFSVYDTNLYTYMDPSMASLNSRRSDVHQMCMCARAEHKCANEWIPSMCGAARS